MPRSELGYRAKIWAFGEIMANLVSRRQFTIEWGYCDPAGIVFNSRFFEFFDWGTWILFETALGVKPQDISNDLGIILPLVDVKARFVAPARFGDAVELASEVSAFRRSSFDVAHRLTVNGELSVEGSESRVWATHDAASPSGIKALPIPDDVIARLQGR
jgi:4-hydroxybenzoyl-CoA thioesterase